MVAANRKAITEMPTQQYKHKKLQNKEGGLTQELHQPTLSLSFR